MMSYLMTIGVIALCLPFVAYIALRAGDWIGDAMLELIHRTVSAVEDEVEYSLESESSEVEQKQSVKHKVEM